MPTVPSQPTTLSQIGTTAGDLGKVGVPSTQNTPDTAAPISSKPGSTRDYVAMEDDFGMSSPGFVAHNSADIGCPAVIGCDPVPPGSPSPRPRKRPPVNRYVDPCTPSAAYTTGNSNAATVNS